MLPPSEGLVSEATFTPPRREQSWFNMRSTSSTVDERVLDIWAALEQCWKRFSFWKALPALAGVTSWVISFLAQICPPELTVFGWSGNGRLIWPLCSGLCTTHGQILNQEALSQQGHLRAFDSSCSIPTCKSLDFSLMPVQLEDELSVQREQHGNEGGCSLDPPPNTHTYTHRPPPPAHAESSRRSPSGLQNEGN